jgi:hypothetical protein
MIFIPTFLFVLWALDIKDKKWTYLLSFAAALNLIFNFLKHWWPADLYATSAAVVLFLLTPVFHEWWTTRASLTDSVTSLYDRIKRYFIIAGLISWILGAVIFGLFKTTFTIPALFTIGFCVILSVLIRGEKRFLIPGVSIILADYVWRTIDLSFLMHVPISAIISEIGLGILMLIGIIWLMKKPGLWPILLLSLILLYRTVTMLDVMLHESFIYSISFFQVFMICGFLFCWMLVFPLVLWGVGMREMRYG